MATAIAIKELSGLKGKLIGTSKWMQFSQQMTNSFADCTEDHQFIHVDERRAKEESPFGGTIAHGFLSLSLLTKLSSETSLKIKGANIALNYGFNKLDLFILFKQITKLERILYYLIMLNVFLINGCWYMTLFWKLKIRKNLRLWLNG